jgi:hypothetical protein
MTRKQPVTPLLQKAISALDSHVEPIKLASPDRMAELLSHGRQVEHTFPVNEITEQIREIQIDLHHICNRIEDAGISTRGDNMEGIKDDPHLSDFEVVTGKRRVVEDFDNGDVLLYDAGVGTFLFERRDDAGKPVERSLFGYGDVYTARAEHDGDAVVWTDKLNLWKRSTIRNNDTGQWDF